jgi:hypothetical protein
MNLIYFRWKFYKFPILVYRHTCIKKHGGCIQIDIPLAIGQLQIGRLRNGFQDAKERTIWNVSGAIILKGKSLIFKSEIFMGCIWGQQKVSIHVGEIDT